VTDRFKYDIEPMDLANMRQNGVRSLDIQCYQCLHQVILSVDHLSGDLTVPSFGPRMVCTKCGTIGADGAPKLAGEATLSLALSARRRGRRSCTPLASEIHEIFLTCLECCGIRTSGTLGIHREPDGPNNKSNDASGHILHDLRIPLIREGLNPLIVCLNFGVDHRTVAVGVLRLDGRHRLCISAGARRQRYPAQDQYENAHLHLSLDGIRYQDATCGANPTA
jgi:hypothetical protein